MRNFRKRYGAYPLLALFFLAASTLMRTVACLTAYDFTWSYYTSSLGAASGFTAAIGALILLSYAFAARRLVGLVASFTSPAAYIPTGIIAVALFFLSRSLLSNARGVFNPGGTSDIIALLSLLCAIFGFIAIGYFLLSAVIDKRHYIFRSNFGLIAVIFLALYASLLYFDKELPVNSPNKITDQLAFLFSAIFFLYETRISLGREKWGAYTAFGFVALLLTAYASIPELIVYFVNGEVLASSLLESILSFSLFVFITARVIIAGIIPEDRETDFITKLKAAAKKRECELSEAHSEPIAVQDVEDGADSGYSSSTPDPDQVSFDFQSEYADEVEDINVTEVSE